MFSYPNHCLQQFLEAWRPKCLLFQAGNMESMGIYGPTDAPSNPLPLYHQILHHLDTSSRKYSSVLSRAFSFERVENTTSRPAHLRALRPRGLSPPHDLGPSGERIPASSTCRSGNPRALWSTTRRSTPGRNLTDFKKNQWLPLPVLDTLQKMIKIN